MTTYQNPFYTPGDRHNSPTITTDAKPTEYKGYIIYERIKGSVWDIVKDGVCVSMMAGPRGARAKVDELTAPQAPSNAWGCKGYL